MRHIVDITNGDDGYAPHVKTGIPPWDYKALEKHVEDTYLTDPRTLAVRDWPDEVIKQGQIYACLEAHPNDYTQKKAEEHIEERFPHDNQAWVRCMARRGSASWYGAYQRAFKRAAKENGLDF